MTKGTERISLEAGPGILIFLFLVQHVTGPSWSEVGEEDSIGMVQEDGDGSKTAG